MKLKDKNTLSIAAAVSDVVEGKVKKEEAKYPHDMFHPETGEKKVAKDEAEHKALADKGYTHDKPEVDEVAEPKAKGEKDFKDAHKVKKTYGPGAVKEQVAFAFDTQKAARDFGNKVDGMPMNIVKVGSGKYYVVELRQDVDKKAREKAAQIAVKIGLSESYLDEAKLKAGKGKAKVDIDHTGEGIPAASKKYNLKFKAHRNGYDVSGEKKNIVAFLQSKDYDMDPEDIEELFPELLEAKSKFQKPQVKKAVALALKMGGNMTGAVNKIEKMKKGLSDDPEVKAALQMANEEVTEEVVAEAHAMNEAKSKMAEDKERYQKFFKSALKKFGVTSPGELEGEKKKEFFNYVDKNYEADNETDKDESVKEEFSKLYEAFNKAKEMKNLKVMKQLYNKASNAKFQVDQNDSDARNDMERALSELDSAIRDYEDEIKSGVHEGTIAEAQIRTSFEADEMKNVGGDKAAKKMKIKISFKKGKGDGMMGSDAGIFTGDEKNLVKYFQDYMGFEGKTFKELQKEYS